MEDRNPEYLIFVEGLFERVALGYKLDLLL